VVTSLKIDDALHARIEALANQRRQSVDGIMREAIEDYVRRAEARASFIQEAEASWAEYQQTGLHLTGQEVRDWLKTWGTAGETEAPECHE
jgi:predicted transcriptional regulator